MPQGRGAVGPAKLPQRFSMRLRGRSQTTYHATAVNGEVELFDLKRPGLSLDKQFVGRIRIVPTAKAKRDGRGYVMQVAVGKTRKEGEAFWEPERPLSDFASMVEGVSVRRKRHAETGTPVLEIVLSYDGTGRTAQFHLLPVQQAKQLWLQLNAIFNPPED